MLAVPPASAEQWTKTFDLAGRPSVHIGTNDGGIRVFTGGSEKQVAIRIEYTGYEPDRDFTIDARQTGNSIDLNARLNKQWCVFCTGGRTFRIEVRMPAAADLQVQTGDGSVEIEPVNGRVDVRTGDGQIKVNGAKGEVRLRTGDGSIEAYRVDGQLDASTGDGHIRAEGRFDRLSIETGDGSVDLRAMSGSKVAGSWNIRTGDGSVSLSVPDDLKANINAHTNDGHINLGIPLQTEGNSRGNTIRGKLNGGGESLSISTGDGSIRLNRS
jgi:hypothetical protein